MMAAAVCLGEEFSPKRLFSLGSLLVPSCLSQGRWRSDNPGRKEVQFLPSPYPHLKQSQLSASKFELGSIPAKNSSSIFMLSPKRSPKPSGMSCGCPFIKMNSIPAALCPRTAVTGPRSPTRQQLNSSVKQKAPRHRQINEMCPQIHSAGGIGAPFPRGWWFSNAPRGTVKFASLLPSCQCQHSFKLPTCSFP